MITHSNTKVNKKSRIETGEILLAQPFWLEEDYKRSVILVLDHDKMGATGVILNKVSNRTVRDALPQFNLYHPVYYGGASKSELVSFIHNFSSLPNVRPLGNGLYWGGEPESLQAKLHTNMLNSSSIKFCAGFVEWTAGELEDEMQAGKWWKTNINAEELFTMPYEKLWSYKLITSGHLYGIFNDCIDPLMN